MMELILPFKTPSINSLYWHRGNIKIMKSEAKKIREAIFDIVVEKLSENGYKDELRGKELRVETHVYENWYNKSNGLIKKKDVANREKFLIDSVFKALDIDDSHIFEHKIKKINSEKEFVKVIIEPLNQSNP